MTKEVHIREKGTEVVIPAGHMNRAMRRRLAKRAKRMGR